MEKEENVDEISGRASRAPSRRPAGAAPTVVASGSAGTVDGSGAGRRRATLQSTSKRLWSAERRW